MAALRPLITSFLGVEKASIRFEKDGLRRSVSIPGVLDQAVEGVPSPTVPGEPLVIDNSIHPVNRRVALARAIRSVLFEQEAFLGLRFPHWINFNSQFQV